MNEILTDPKRFDALTEAIRDALHRKARDVGKADPAKALRKLDREIDTLKASLTAAVATPRSLALLEELLKQREEERARLLRHPGAEEIEKRLAQVLAGLQARVRRYLDDLDSLLAVHQVNRGRKSWPLSASRWSSGPTANT